MGLLNWLKSAKSNVRVLDDVIWLTKKAKLTGISMAVARRLAEPDGPVAVLLVAHFPDCFAELEGLVGAEGFDKQRVVAATAKNLEGTIASITPRDESQGVDVIVGERHPLQSHDEGIVDVARKLPCRCRLVRHLSLEDPLMRIFVGAWVESILEPLGLSEDQAIESRVVTRRVKRAQQELESRAVGDVPANSAEEWLEFNCPEVWRKRLFSRTTGAREHSELGSSAKGCFRFSLAVLSLVAVASFILGNLDWAPWQYAAGLAGLGALVSVFMLAVLKPARSVIYVGSWVVLGLCLLSCFRAIITGP